MARTRRSESAQSENFPGFTDLLEIGTGSRATVFRAREAGTDRLVALKLLDVGDASSHPIEVFERDSVTLGAISSHPNIVTLHRSFLAPDGRPVLVLELCTRSIAGRLAAQLSAGQPGLGLPAVEVVSLGIKIAAALETAHRAGVLHRDVTPRNILVTELGQPALADLGVATLQSSTRTTAGPLDFTNLHAAPELFEAAEASPVTDVYEMASTLYQLLAGRSAFRAYAGESAASVILRILRDPVQPVVDATVPPALSDLLVRAMSKAPADRPATAADLTAELLRIEAAHAWARTPYVVRDAAGAPVELPRPQVVAPPLPPPATPSPPPPVPPEVATADTNEWSATTVSRREPAAPQPAVQPAAPQPAAPQPYVVPRSVAEPDASDPAVPTVRAARHAAPDEAASAPEPPAQDPIAQSPDGVWTFQDTAPDPGPAPDVPFVPWRGPLDDDVEPSHPAAEPDPAPPSGSRQDSQQPDVPQPDAAPSYPIPPPGAMPDPVANAVPVWTFRAQVPPGPSALTDLRLDPAALRERVTIRAAGASLSIDAVKLVSRQWLKRQEIPWHDVLGFDTRRDGDGPAAGGVVLAITHQGPVELAATRGTAADLRYTHALLEAYRHRSRLQ